MEAHMIGTVLQLWVAAQRIIGGMGLGELTRLDAPPTLQNLALLGTATLLIPVAVRLSGRVFRLTIVLMALSVPVYVVLPIFH